MKLMRLVKRPVRYCILTATILQIHCSAIYVVEVEYSKEVLQSSKTISANYDIHVKLLIVATPKVTLVKNTVQTLVKVLLSTKSILSAQIAVLPCSVPPNVALQYFRSALFCQRR